MTACISGTLLAASLALVPIVAHAEWQALEKVQTYPIVGQSGAELYRSIGERGPQSGSKARAIANTKFTLTWSRKYTKQGQTCTVATAIPKLTIVYTLPKPAQTLPPKIHKRWEIFSDGIRKHEQVHAETIIKFAQDAAAATIGLSVANDPQCRKIKHELATIITELLQIQRQSGRDFDRIEMSQNGNIHQLILNLINEH